MTLKSSVEAIAFTRVTALAERMKVAEVVAATQRQRDNMVNGQVLGSAALLALVTIALKNIGTSRCRYANSLGLLRFHQDKFCML